MDLHEGQEGLTVIPASLGLARRFTVHDPLSNERFEWRIGHGLVSFTPDLSHPHLLWVER